MTWTYTAPGYTTAAEVRDAVRLKIGDTDTNDQQLTDEEIAHVTSSATSADAADVLDWAIVCVRLLVARFSRQVSYTRDGLSVSASDRAGHYRDLLATLEEEAAGLLESDDAAVGVWAGGQSIAEKQAVADDEDQVQPIFDREMDDNPNDGSSNGSPFRSQ